MGWWRRIEVAALIWAVSFEVADSQELLTLAVDTVDTILANMVTIIDVVAILHVEITIPTYC